MSESNLDYYLNPI